MPDRLPVLRPSYGPSREVQRRRYDLQRAADEPWRKWYGTQRWKRRRREQLDRIPNCERCAEDGELVEATVADHAEPHRGDPEKFWHGRLCSLCDWHHNSAKQREEKRGGRGV